MAPIRKLCCINAGEKMRKITATLLVFMILFLPGCRKETFALEDGMYVPEHVETDQITVPYLLIKDGSMTIVQNVAVSYQPSGPLTVSGNKIVMETQFLNETCKWTFVLSDDNTLEYSSGESGIPGDLEKWEDGMKFLLAKE